MKHLSLPASRADFTSLEAAVAQLIMVDLPGLSATPEIERRMRESQWGGVILFAKNVASRSQVAELCRSLQALSEVPLLMAVDQEGGMVNRIAFEDSATGCGNMALAATGSTELTYEVCKASARELRSAGFNVDFAPCIDINNNPQNPIIGVRSFGQDARRAAEFGAAAVKGYQDGGISACAKHFPGHGDTHLDSHMALPSVAHSLEKLEQVELVPFQASIDAGVDGMMTAHITYPALDDVPATMSEKILTGLLRHRMKFDGVIYTDSLAMKAIADNFGVGDAAVRSVQAGADVVLALGPEEVQQEVLQALCKAVESGRIPAARFDDALRRVMRLKQLRRAGEPHDGAASPAEDHDLVRRAAEASITVLRNPNHLLPLKQPNVLVVSPASLPQSPLGELAEFGLLGQLFSGAEVCSYPGDDTPFDMDALVQKTRGKSAVVLGLYARGGLPAKHQELADRLARSGIPLVVALLGNPYVAAHLDPNAALVAAYNFTRPSLRALAQVIRGELTPRGHIPVTLPGVCEAGTGLTW